MKSIVKFLIFSLLIVGCKKDKLEGDQLLLEGKWRWSYTMEYTYSGGMQTSATKIPSSNFSDTYEIEFDRKGKVKYLKNGEMYDKFRIVFATFEDDPYNYFENSYFYSILLNNDEDNELLGYFNADSMNCFGQKLPIENWGVSNQSLAQEYYYIKVN